jgi:ubiquinone/menaquinone biosynthesis C-methylase UbiE
LVNEAHLNSSSRVLEVGAGTGNYSRALRALVGSHCSALEPSRAMRDVMLSASGDVCVVAGVGEQLPFGASSFDLVFCVDVAHHFTDPAAFVGEAFRVLKGGGLLCIVTDSHEIIRTRAPLAIYFPETIPADLARYPAVEKLRELAESAGFGQWRETLVATETTVSSLEAYETKAFSVLHLIPQASFDAGLARIRADLERGPLRGLSSYALLWSTK